MAATPSPLLASPTGAGNRLAHIGAARQTLLYGAPPPDATLTSHQPPVAGWLEQSWRRSLAHGHRPQDTPQFDVITADRLRNTLDASRLLRQAARPVLDQLGLAIAGSRYFAVLTNADGIVIDAGGLIDTRDPRALLVSRVGADLSERRVGTTAIGAALAAQESVWLHRGEHFFEANSVYSCAGAPLFGPDGQCIGMLDLTGIETVERPELRHLAVQSARQIDNALLMARPHALLLRLNWPGRALGDDGDGLLTLDAEGNITGSNHAARQLLPSLGSARSPTEAPWHCTDLFATPFEPLFDIARRGHGTSAGGVDLPLWSGLRLQALPLLPGHRKPVRRPAAHDLHMPAVAPGARPLRDLETALIRQAVDDARGNVLQAAKALGVSRATVYRRLNPALRRREISDH